MKKLYLSLFTVSLFCFNIVSAQENVSYKDIFTVTADVSKVKPTTVKKTEDIDVIFGKPIHRTWNLDQNDRGVTFGIWEGTTGKWNFSIDHWEYCRILTGESIITDVTTGKTFHVKSGDSFVLQPGFSGTWEAISTTRKEFIVR